MITILYDPTEDRKRTRLPQEIIQLGNPLKGLEALTGADLLITPDECSLTSISEEIAPPLLERFREVCNSGILVQRKSGRDLLSSLGDLNKILLKMSRWTREPWLVSTGRLGERSGICTINGRGTKVPYASYMAKVTWWQRRGGMYVHLLSDEKLAEWIKSWDKWFKSADSRYVQMERYAAQTLIPAGWWERIAVWEGFGAKRAHASAEYLEARGLGTMANATEYFTGDNYAPNDHPVGIGPSHFKSVKRWHGLEEDERMIIVKEIDNG